MKLTVLVDNNTIIDRYHYGEPGVSYLVETEDSKILFDTGYSDLFLMNAIALEKDLGEIDFLVLSHGHNDHSGGLSYLNNRELEKNKLDRKERKVNLIAHPDVFLTRTEDTFNIGSPVKQSDLNEIFEISLTKDPLWLTSEIVFLGEIPRGNSFENQESIGEILKSNQAYDDFVLDDSALVYKSKQGLFVITGCSHAGICNIIEHAIKVCGENRIAGIIGGFHLLDPSEEQFNGTLNYLSKANIMEAYPCHCTSLRFKIELSKLVNVKEVGVGLEIQF
ncbi:MAG: MBL fold metallo-hydrolase [Desulfotalea sp.]